MSSETAKSFTQLRGVPYERALPEVIVARDWPHMFWQKDTWSKRPRKRVCWTLFNSNGIFGTQKVATLRTVGGTDYED